MGTANSFLILSIVFAGALGARPATAAKTPEKPQPTALELQRASLQKQREGLKQQLGSKIQPLDTDFGFLEPIRPIMAAECSALDGAEVESLVAAAAKKQSLSPDLVRAVMRQESAFKPCAVSDKGAQGLMQLMPATAAQLHVADPFDPEQNVQGGAAFLKQLMKKYNGDVRLALIGYNAGAGVADQHSDAVLPQETQGYLANIFGELGTDQTQPVESEATAEANTSPQ